MLLCSYLLHSILYYLSCDYRYHPNDRQVIHADVSRNDRHVCNGQDQSNGYLQAPIPEHARTAILPIRQLCQKVNSYL